ncbi:MAG: hypothetical protein ABI615_04265 [Chthoniobacterales bacterium]
MNPTFHLFKKDVRHTRILLAVWLVLVLLQFTLVGIGASPGDKVMQAVYETLTVILPLLQALLLIVIIPYVVHGEPLVGTTAFWFTRPISPKTLLKAKGLFAGVILLVPLLVQVVVLTANGATPHDIALALPEILLSEMALLFSVSVLAALTPNFGIFAVAGAVFLIGTILISTGISFGRLFFNPESMVRSMQDFSLLKSRGVAGSIFTIVLGGGIVLHQFTTRRTKRSIILAAIALPVIVAAQNFWAWDFLKPVPVQMAAAPFDVPAVKADLAGSINASDVMAFRGTDKSPNKMISAAIDVQRVPPSYVTEVSDVNAKLMTPQGQVLKVGDGSPTNYFEPQAAPIEAVLKGAVLINARDGGFNVNQQLFSIDGSLYAQYGNAPLKFSADVDVTVSQYVITASMALRKGVRFDEGSTHIVITDVLHQPDGLDILMRERKLKLLFDRNSSNEMPGIDRRRVVYVLSNRKRKEALLAKRDNNFSFSMNMSMLINKPVRVAFGPENNDSFVFPKLTDEWLADAELLRLELVPAARFSKTLKDDAFRMDGKGRAWKGMHSTQGKIDPQVLEKIILPPNPTKEQVEEYVRSILIASQRYQSYNSKDPQIAMLLKVGPEHLDSLIELKNTHGGAGYYIEQAVPQLVRDEDKDLIVGALADKPWLASIIVKKGWEKDAREILLEGLNRKQADLPTPWIQALVALQDPTTYDALKTYYLRQPGRMDVFEALRKLPDIDLTDTVNTAWEKKKSGRDYEVRALMATAAEYGHADALDAAAKMLKSGSEHYARRLGRDVLVKFTAATGDDAAVLAWYDANKDRLVFDPETKKFIVKP